MNQPAQVDQTNVTPRQMLLNAENPRERQILLVEREFEMQQRSANVLASSDVVPAQYKGKLANCIIAQDIANRLNVGALEVMQNLYVVHGNPSFSAKYKIARANTSGKLDGQLEYNFIGTEGQDDWGCYCTGIDAKTGKTLKGPEITIKLAKDEKWFERNGSKWRTMPEKMLRYRAASWFIDVFMPETTFGMMSTDEAEDAGPRAERDITPLSETNLNETFKPRLVAREEAEGNEVETVDEQTGEVTEQPQGGQEAESESSKPGEGPAQQSLVDNPDTHSPAFQTLKKELETAMALEQGKASAVSAVFGKPAFKKLNQKEQSELQQLVVG